MPTSGKEAFRSNFLTAVRLYMLRPPSAECGDCGGCDDSGQGDGLDGLKVHERAIMEIALPTKKNEAPNVGNCRSRKRKKAAPNQRIQKGVSHPLLSKKLEIS